MPAWLAGSSKVFINQAADVPRPILAHFGRAAINLRQLLWRNAKRKYICHTRLYDTFL